MVETWSNRRKSASSAGYPPIPSMDGAASRSPTNCSGWLQKCPADGVSRPVGVYRFRSHEEADEWLMKMLTRPKRGSQP